MSSFHCYSSLKQESSSGRALNLKWSVINMDLHTTLIISKECIHTHIIKKKKGCGTWQALEGWREMDIKCGVLKNKFSREKRGVAIGRGRWRGKGRGGGEGERKNVSSFWEYSGTLVEWVTTHRRIHIIYTTTWLWSCLVHATFVVFFSSSALVESIANLQSGLHSLRKHVNPCQEDEGGHLWILLGGSLMFAQVRCGCIPNYPPQGATTTTSRRHTILGKAASYIVISPYPCPGHSHCHTDQPLSHSQHPLQRSFSHSSMTHLWYCLSLCRHHLYWVALFLEKDEHIYSPQIKKQQIKVTIPSKSHLVNQWVYYGFLQEQNDECLEGPTG